VRADEPHVSRGSALAGVVHIGCWSAYVTTGLGRGLPATTVVTPEEAAVLRAALVFARAPAEPMLVRAEARRQLDLAVKTLRVAVDRTT